MSLLTVTSETLSALLTGNDLVILTFRRQESPSYAALEPDLVTLSDANPDVRFGTVDVDLETEIAASARIDAIPTIMAFREGNLVFREKGALEWQALEQLVVALRGLDLDQVRQALQERAQGSEPANGEIGVAEARELIGSGRTVIDVRTPLEYASAHIPGAVLLPLHELSRSTDRFGPDEPVLLVCKDGERSRQAAQLLAGQGVRADVIAGGMTAWSAEDGPVESGRPG